ncbi:nuclear transport factor 2 family protein [Synechocystis sp. LKSZ1]|uniref:nuclear transport factor 2 family protein n=1 Tax=Synechocystis sp. LKSZ1 TaxID=3144951 RepID=UPI00336BC160
MLLISEDFNTHEASLRRLVSQFADAVNRRDADLFKTLWLEEGVWEIKPPIAVMVTGQNNIVDIFSNLLARWDFFVQMIHSGVVSIAGEQAQARWCMEEIGRSHDGQGFHNYGYYEDQFVLREGRWYFARRTYHFYYLEEPQLTGTTFSLAASKALTELT